MSEFPKARDFFESSTAAVADHELRRKLESASARHLDHFAQVKAEFPPYDDERDAAHRIKTDAIAHLDELLIELTAKLEARGCKVFFAEDAAQARDYIVALAKAKGAQQRRQGQVDDDRGDRSQRQRSPRPASTRSKPTSASISCSFAASARRISSRPRFICRRKTSASYSPTSSASSTPPSPKNSRPKRARACARFFSRADFGVTGVNFAIAETGTLIVVENEGNGRLSSTMPETFVAVMGIEKVIPRLEDLSHFLEILARTATGQKLTTYTSFITGPRREGDLDGPAEMHVVILDNGRSSMLADPVLREALNCIRCGACLNVCPIYRRIGGHAYRSVYPGPIGSIVSPNLFGSAAGHLPFASTLCGACKDICPVKIDIPRILLHLRWKESTGEHPLKWPRAIERARRGARRFAKTARYPRTIRALGKFAAIVLKPFAHNGYLRRMPGPFGNWTKYRNFPRPRPHKRPPG